MSEKEKENSGQNVQEKASEMNGNTQKSAKKHMQMTNELKSFVDKANIIPYGLPEKKKPNINNMRIRVNTMKKRERTPWTEVEVYYLQKGVEKFGKGNWKRIYDEFSDSFHPGRRYHDLKDKYRLIEKRTDLKYELKEHVYVDENGVPLSDLTLNHVYPRDAAYDVAKKFGLDDEIIYIAEKSNFDSKSSRYTKILAYFASVIEGKLTLRRIIEDKN